MTELKKTLRDLLLEGDTKEAYELLLENLKEESSHLTTVYLRLADYNGLQKDIAKGIAVNVQQREAQINHALNYIIQNLEVEDLVSD